MVNSKIQSINEDCFHLSKLHCFKPDLTVLMQVCISHKFSFELSVLKVIALNFFPRITKKRLFILINVLNRIWQKG